MRMKKSICKRHALLKWLTIQHKGYITHHPWSVLLPYGQSWFHILSPCCLPSPTHHPLLQLPLGLMMHAQISLYMRRYRKPPHVRVCELKGWLLCRVPTNALLEKHSPCLWDHCQQCAEEDEQRGWGRGGGPCWRYVMVVAVDSVRWLHCYVTVDDANQRGRWRLDHSAVQRGQTN